MAQSNGSQGGEKTTIRNSTAAIARRARAAARRYASQYTDESILPF